MSNMRVRVFDGRGDKFLGFGRLVGEVTVYGLISPNKDEIITNKNPEVNLPDIIPPESGWTPIEMRNNPKIVLDDGRIVYGCQVWWEEADA